MATSKKFSELPVASSLNNGDLFAVAQEDAQAETGYTSKSATALVVGKKLNGEIEYATDLPSFPSGSQNPLDALELLKQEILDLYPVDSSSGSLVNFSTSLELPLVALKTYIKAQGGGGTPSAPVPVVGYDEVNLTNNPTLQYLDSSTPSATSNGITATNLGSGKYRISGSLSTNASATLNFTIPSLVIYGGEDSYFEMHNTANMPNAEIIFKNDGANVERWAFSPANKTSTYSGMRNKTMNSFSIYIPSSYYGQTLDFTIQPVMYGTNSATTFTIALGQTVYGGYVDWENGKLVLTWGYITSYNGETLTGEWLSSMDTYSQGTTPTIGAEVAYELAIPIEISLPTTMPQTISGEQNWFADSGDIELAFKMGVQEYIDKKIAETQALVL